MREIGRYPGERTSRPARETKLTDRFPMPAEPSLFLGMFHVEHWSNPPNPVSGLARPPGSRTNVPRGTFFLRPCASRWSSIKTWIALDRRLELKRTFGLPLEQAVSKTRHPIGIPIRPDVPRGTPRRTSETEGANDPFAKLSECSTWNIRRSPPLVASSFSSRSFTRLRMGPSALPGRRKSECPLPG